MKYYPLAYNPEHSPLQRQYDQLIPKETEETEHIASARIQVEGAIDRAKNYHILDGVCLQVCILSQTIYLQYDCI